MIQKGNSEKLGKEQSLEGGVIWQARGFVHIRVALETGSWGTTGRTDGLGNPIEFILLQTVNRPGTKAQVNDHYIGKGAARGRTKKVLRGGGGGGGGRVGKRGEKGPPFQIAL